MITFCNKKRHTKKKMRTEAKLLITLNPVSLYRDCDYVIIYKCISRVPEKGNYQKNITKNNSGNFFIVNFNITSTT